MAVTKSQKAAEKAAEAAAREKATATTGQGSGDEGGPAAAAPAVERNPQNPTTRALESVMVVDETGLKELQIAVGELQVAVKRLMVDREVVEDRRREEMDEIRRTLSKLTLDAEAKQGNPPRIETPVDLGHEGGEGPIVAAESGEAAATSQVAVA
ncbi:unnamed protein product [Linum trigynum]|uniref:BAG domain-containing protein n=1 Tax=Linum trigynum TaxID=586398 RepID=A0AAV2CC54_9ROSI